MVFYYKLDFMYVYNRHIIVIIHKFIIFTIIWIVGDGWELLNKSCFLSHESLKIKESKQF